MRRKTLAPSFLVLSLLVAAMTPREASAKRPPRPASAAVWETLGGVAGGAVLGFAGGWIGASFSHCKDGDQTPWGGCSDALGQTFLGLLAGYSIGTPLGVWLTGKALQQGGSGAAAAVGSFFGEVAGVTLVARLNMNADLELPVILVVPAVASTFAYHFFADPREESETAWRMRELGGRGAWAIAPAANGASPRELFRADLYTYRF